jgi:hypothetical protein
MPIDIIALREKLTKMADEVAEIRKAADSYVWHRLETVIVELRELEMALWKEESQ